MNAIGRLARDTPRAIPHETPSRHAVDLGSTTGIEGPGDDPEPSIDRGGSGPLTEPLRGELRPAAAPEPVTVRKLSDRDRLLFSLSNDNWFSMIGMAPGTGFGAGDDFGPTHGFNLELRLCRENASYFFGAGSEIATREIAPRRTRADGKDLATQNVVEVSKLYFAVELSPKSEGYTRLYGGVGLRNGQREIPGLAMWFQQGLHSMLKRAPAFDNIPGDPLQPFLEVGAARGFRTELPGLSEKIRIRGEVGATLNTIFSGSRAFALVEAELPIAGPLQLRGAQLAQILAGQKFSFVSSGGIFMEFPTWMIGAQAKLPLGALDDKYMKFGDPDPVLELRVEVGL